MKRFVIGALVVSVVIIVSVFVGSYLLGVNVRAEIDGRLITYSPEYGDVYYEPKTGDIESVEFPDDVNVFRFARIKNNFLIYDDQKPEIILCNDKNVLKRFSVDFNVLSFCDYKDGAVLMAKSRDSSSSYAEIYYLNLESDIITKLTECTADPNFFVSDGKMFTFLQPDSNKLSVYLADGSICVIEADTDLYNLSGFMDDNTLAGVAKDFSLVGISIHDGNVTVIKKKLKCLSDGVLTEDKKYYIYAVSDITALFSRSAIRAVRISDGFDVKILSEKELYIESRSLMWE